MMTRQLAIFINVSVEEAGQKFLTSANIFEELQELIKHCKSGVTLEREILERVFNLISKLFRNPEAIPVILKQKHTIFKAVLYFNKEFKGELQMNALRTLHPLMKHPDFKKTCFEEHQFTVSMFDTYVKEVLIIFNESMKPGEENWTDFVNACGSIVAFVVAFPERLVEF